MIHLKRTRNKEVEAILCLLMLSVPGTIEKRLLSFYPGVVKPGYTLNCTCDHRW